MSQLIHRLNQILKEFAHHRVDGKIASHATTTTTGQGLRTCFCDLVKIGYRIEEPRNLSQVHIQALCGYWFREKLALSTIQSRLSLLRIFCRWIGKPGMVKSLPQYLPDVPPAQLRVRKVAASSKSWTENGVDVADMILRADRIDTRFGLMLRIMLAFGLRRMEVLQLRPWKSDKQTSLRIFSAKNGRLREIPIERAEQRLVLDYVKAEIPRPDPLGWSLTLLGAPASLGYNTRLYNKRMAEIGITRADAGVTGHGLRAQYAENAALMMHLIPPTLGGTGGQLPKDVITLHRQQVSENLGHSRVSVTAAYYGSFPRYAKPDDADRARSVIAGCISSLDSAALPKCPPERRVDCLNLISELAVINVDVTVRQIHRIWCAASARHGRAWVTPVESGNLEEIEVAARSCDLNAGS